MPLRREKLWSGNGIAGFSKPKRQFDPLECVHYWEKQPQTGVAGDRRGWVEKGEEARGSGRGRRVVSQLLNLLLHPLVFPLLGSHFAGWETGSLAWRGYLVSGAPWWLLPSEPGAAGRDSCVPASPSP